MCGARESDDSGQARYLASLAICLAILGRSNLTLQAARESLGCSRNVKNNGRNED